MRISDWSSDVCSSDLSLSPVAPWRVVNIGGGRPTKLLDFIAAVEAALGQPAKRNMLPMQPGDVVDTWADSSLLDRLTGYVPQTGVRSEERRVGTEGGRTCNSRWSAFQ